MSVSMQQRSLPDLGEVVGKYRIIRKLGEGGMGVVYEAEHTRIQQRVAIKMLLPEVLDLPDVVSRFEREARAAGKLKSENTARVLDVDVSDRGVPYMVMEFLEGSDLGKVVELGALPIAEAVDYVLQACNAMAEAHAAGVIHRDLKPSNLFVTQSEGARRVKVLDFGISKVENDAEARVTATQTVVGTPLYMSPEQVRSAKHVDARTDIWSLGIILYELLAGRTPFEGSTTAAAVAICVDQPPPLASFRSDVPAGLEQAILKALDKDPNGRFPNVKALADAIAPFGSGAVQAPQAFVTAPRAESSASFPRKVLESALTLPDQSSNRSEPRAAGGATMPGWTTPPTTAPKRTLWLVAAGVLVVVAASAFVVVRVVTANHTTSERVESPKPTAPAVTTESPAPTIAPPPVATHEPTASATTSAKPPPPATTARPHATATATAPATTTTATHTAAPLPTRL